MGRYLQVKVRGFAELDTALAELPKALRRNVVRQAAVKALTPVRDLARALVPLRTGALLESIQVSTRLTRRQRRGRAERAYTVEAYVGSGGKGARHAHLVEFGTKKMAARPFLRPAWDTTKREVLEILKLELWRMLAKAARRLAAKAPKR
jgi:HK97 gp10 family phage protein